ncbi:DUF3095 domain-containing protein [Leptospira sp. GIMC2001]|uniref:DUF3095 domain-containing protein n=1 Tax=Leptospira sp. GIMC2001 TaxID=1513297 RepID=UPI00234AF682|nr:DUF3095 domain-containing protein [Leptospira sp. GIMC2001]WCL49484.1 DUF3095 domain-containing protein [Leptospira sp. GIMC2001]
MSGNDFYRNLPAISNFSDLLRSESYTEVPDDWWIVVTDVQNSTKAIEEGRYKDVNISGGLCAMALSNLVTDMEHPFVFGGDGITFLIPGNILADVRSVLMDTKKSVKNFFDLDLRVGVVPIAKLKIQNKPILVGKWTISKYYKQAILRGPGVGQAESWVKEFNSPYTIGDDEPTPILANFNGFTCRWKDIPSPQGETISLIIRFLSEFDDTENFNKTFTNLETILGDVNDYHPLNEANLDIVNQFKILAKEAMVSARSSRGLGKIFNLARIYIETLVMRLAIFFRLPIKSDIYILKDLKAHQVNSSDFRKFDGDLKMVVSLTDTKRKSMVAYLDEQEKAGRLVYGMHISDRALLTCLMHSDSKSEVHFVDGADGGYAMAAKILKSKL